MHVAYVHGFAHCSSTDWKLDCPSVETDAVKVFRDSVLELFPICGPYILDSITYKLRNPRAKGKLIIGYGRFGGEGKNTKENIVKRIFGPKRCISTPDAGNLTGKGDQGFNGGIEGKLVAFLQEAKSEGKSITDDDKFKNFLSESTYPLRRMNRDPILDNPNFIWTWLWSNNPSCVKMSPAMLRRTVAEQCSAEKMDDKEHFDRLRAIEANDQQIQEIFTWFWNRDISKFDVEAIPDKPFKRRMAETSLSTTQRYIVDVCNGRRENLPAIAREGVTKVRKTELYSDYKQWAEEEGLQPRFRAILKNFTEEVVNLDIVCKEARIGGGKATCFHFNIDEIEAVMRKFQRNKEWKLLVDEPELDNEEDDE